MADIISPLPGIFYRKPAPDKEPFVNEGDRIEAGQPVGMVEIMKQFSEIRSEVSGTLERFTVDDAGTVNPGDVIAVVAEQ